MLGEGVARFGEDLDELVLGEFAQRGDHRQAADEFGDEAVVQQVLRLHAAEDRVFILLLFVIGGLAGVETERIAAEPAADDVLEADECAAYDEEDLLGVDLDVFLLRVFATSLGRDAADCAFENFEECLLHAFAGNIAGDRNIFRFASDFVDFVDIDDAAFGAGDIEVGGLKEAQDDVFHILADVASLGEGGGIDDAKGDIEHAGERAGEQGFAGSGGAEQEDVGFFDFHILEFIAKAGLILIEALVVVVDRDREDFFRFLLADHERVEVFEDRCRRGDAEGGFVGLAFAFFRCAAKFLFEDVRANPDALVADVNAGAGDELFDLRVALSAERAHGEIGGAGHRGDWV